MEDKFEHIHQATDRQLASLLEPYARNEPHDVKKELILEVCRRLRAYVERPAIPFNHEQFNCP